MPASCTSDSRKPACTRPRPSASRSTGKAGGSLPTWRAAATPPSDDQPGRDASRVTGLTAAPGGPVSRSCSRTAKRSVMPAM